MATNPFHLPRNLSVFWVLLVLLFGACSESDPQEPVSLVHQAYVWQRAWTGPVQRAVEDPPETIHGLRVLAWEIEETGIQVWPNVRADALASSEQQVVAVVRINGFSLPETLSLAPLVARVQKWRRAGVQVVGIEVDHDSATSQLGRYTQWLSVQKIPEVLSLSITGLPTWMESPNLVELAKVVDELVLQVHAVVAPEIFDGEQALQWVERYSHVVGGRPFRVSLPTYSAKVKGALKRADPVEVQEFLAALQESSPRGLLGVNWFRLPVAGDRAAWPVATLEAVLRQKRLRSDVRVFLEKDSEGLFSVVLSNLGSTEGVWPSIRVHGTMESADLFAGYTRGGDGYTSPHYKLVAGEKKIIGWIRGKDLYIETY